jgi:hypothetical protein
VFEHGNRDDGIERCIAKRQLLADAANVGSVVWRDFEIDYIVEIHGSPGAPQSRISPSA